MILQMSLERREGSVMGCDSAGLRGSVPSGESHDVGVVWFVGEGVVVESLFFAIRSMDSSGSKNAMVGDQAKEENNH